MVKILPFHCSRGGFDPSWGKFCPLAARRGQNETKGKLVLGSQWVGGAYHLFSTYCILDTIGIGLGTRNIVENKQERPLPS